MPSGIPYLGPPGGLVALPAPAPGYDDSDQLKQAVHELRDGIVVDRFVDRRRFVLRWPGLRDDKWSLIRTLVHRLGPLRYLHPWERNLLTTNQSTGTDEERKPNGFSALTQGAVSSSTVQARSGPASLAWDTLTALAATGRGIRLYNDVNTVDRSWAAVRPNVAHTISTYVRASAAVSLQPGINWYDKAGAQISTPSGAGVAVSTTDWSTRLSFTDTSPSNAAYGIGRFVNTTTTGAAITVWFDDPQLEEAGSASSWLLGAGTPLVTPESLRHQIIAPSLYEVELVLLEVG